MSTDPQAGCGFYETLLGWSRDHALNMGPMGTYQLFSWRGQQIGGMMELGNAPRPCWLPYFGTNGVRAAIDRITEAGGTVMHGPQEVPGGAHIAIVRDPQHATFAIVGPMKVTP